jgi:site-specific DNA recombinase
MSKSLILGKEINRKDMDAIYARQSIDKKDSLSIETQVKGEPRLYIDRGISGKNVIHRPEFQNLKA